MPQPQTRPHTPLFINKIDYPTLITWTSPDGKLHVPPDPPLIKGYPPWFPRPNEYRRRPPLKKCPDTKCRRAGKCVSLLYGEFCQKTHMEADAYRAALADKIDRLMREKLGDEWDRFDDDEPYDPCPTPHPDIKRALEKAQAEKEHQELLNWQTQWIEKVKREYAAKTKKTAPQTPRNNPALTKMSPHAPHIHAAQRGPFP